MGHYRNKCPKLANGVAMATVEAPTLGEVMEINKEEGTEAAELAVAELQDCMGEGVASALMLMQPLVSRLWQMK